MGVKGLYSFLKRSQYRGKQENLCETAINENGKTRKGIVFDGNGIMYYLLSSSTKLNLGLQVSFIHGFQNSHFYHLTLQFFRNFLSQGIRIYVIFDGPRPVFKSRSSKANDKTISSILNKGSDDLLNSRVGNLNPESLFPSVSSHVF